MRFVFLFVAGSLVACGDAESELGKSKGRADEGASSTEQLTSEVPPVPVENSGALPGEPLPDASPAPPAVDGGALDASSLETGAPPGPPRDPCYDLAFCCAQPKPCDAETIACVKVVQTKNVAKCAAAIDGYRVTKCSHGFETEASFLPNFYGCYDIGGGGGGY